MNSNPFIPISCERLLSIKSLTEYSYTRVRVFGELLLSGNNFEEIHYLKSCGEDSSNNIKVDFR